MSNINCKVGSLRHIFYFQALGEVLGLIDEHTRVLASVSEGVELGSWCNNRFTGYTPVDTRHFIGAESHKQLIHPTRQPSTHNSHHNECHQRNRATKCSISPSFWPLSLQQEKTLVSGRERKMRISTSLKALTHLHKP